MIGLCLSGGGFRASFYSLGVLRYLAEADLLKNVGAVSAVSGGSVVAAVFADRADVLAQSGWSLEALLRHVDAPFRHTVTTKNLRNRWLLRSVGARMMGRTVGRGKVLGEILAHHLYRTVAMKDLPDGPQVIITTTDLMTGRAFRFCRDFMGSYDLGYVPLPTDVTLGFAAAASASVPFLFPPASLRVVGAGLTGAPSTLSLADGGIYDNLGLEWFQGWSSGRPPSAVKPDFLLVVNASGPLTVSARTYGGLRGTWRAKDVQYSQTTNLRVRRFVSDLLNEHESGAYVGIGLDPRAYRMPDGTPVPAELHSGALPSSFVRPLAMLRTDLDRLEVEEADLLSYHGYWSAHARLAALFPDLALRTPTWIEFADLAAADAARLEQLLVRGRKRIRFA